MSRKILLTGPAGSGKTHTFLQDFEETLRVCEDPLADDFFFVLPSAEHTERVISIILQRQTRGFFHRRVTTLSRLIPSFFGVGEEGVATNVTRYLLLREVLEEQPEGYFQEVRETPGFLNLLLGFITELKESLILPDVFRARMNSLKLLESQLAPKYEALAFFYEKYQEKLREKGLRDRQDALQLYRQRRENAPPLKKIRKVWLDGFFDFSDLQAAYLKELCDRSEEICVSLTLDPNPERRDLFESVYRTETLLLEMGFEKKELAWVEPSPFPGVLSEVEKRIFSSVKKEKLLKPSREITVFEAIGVEGEVEMIARTIEHMQRQGGFRFSDFAILLRDIGEYGTVIRSVFDRYRIPVEIHERERLSFAPMIPVISALLKIFRDGWKFQDLMTFLKSGYVKKLGEYPKDYEWTGKLEHEALKRKVLEGRDSWLAPWNCQENFETSRLERLKVLADLEDSLSLAKSFQAQKNILRKAVEDIFEIFQTSDSNEEYFRRDAASYRRFLSLLDEIEISAKQEPLSTSALADRFFRLVDLDLYSLHDHNRNRVQIYNVSLARQKEYKVVFIAGLLEKKFPVQIKEDPLLSDWERQLFNGLGGEGILKERLSSQSVERYLFYVALTRVRHKLFLSYPKLDLEGKEYLPSFYVEEVKSLFEGALPERKQKLAKPFPLIEDAVNIRELENAVMGSFWDPSQNRQGGEPLLLETAARLLEQEDSRKRLNQAFYEVHDELTDPEIQKLNVFRPRRTSSTALEEYAKCPFKYYAHRVLKLQDPEEDKNVMFRGIILHEVLEHCFKSWEKNPQVLQDPQRALREALKKLEETLPLYPLLSYRRYQYELEISDIRDMLTRFLEAELSRLSESPLKPAHFELAFGMEEGGTPALLIEDGNQKIEICGKIDRVDLEASRKAGLVLDYKRTAVFSREALELGTALQLPIYAMVLERLLKVPLAGAELYSLKKREKKGFYKSNQLGFFPGISSRRMILDDAAYQALTNRVEALIRKFTHEREAMRIAVRPRECQDFCPYTAVCRTEKWKHKMILEEIKAEDALEIPPFLTTDKKVSGTSENEGNA